MKIKKSITRKVKEATANMRETLIGATIAMLQQMGVETGQTAKFERHIVLTRTKPGREDSETVTETRLADGIAYESSSKGSEFLMLEYENGCTRTLVFMTLDELLTVYEAVRRMTLAY